VLAVGTSLHSPLDFNYDYSIELFEFVVGDVTIPFPLLNINQLNIICIFNIDKKKT
jgi:hypothetical protein